MTSTPIGIRNDLTHRGNLRSSRFGWLRLTPMYSVHLVAELLGERADDVRVLDPFCGTGTTALLCSQRGIECDTTDINPFLVWLTNTKCHDYTEAELRAARESVEIVLDAACDAGAGVPWLPPLANIEKWWDEDVAGALSRAWACITSAHMTEPSRWLLTIAFLRTAIRAAHVTFGHQSMSFKKRRSASDWTDLLSSLWTSAVEDVARGAASPIHHQNGAMLCDARQLHAQLPDKSYSLVITSPPYCNRMSYIRELRPYMYWMGFLADGRTAGELDWSAIGGTWGIATSNVAKWEAPRDKAVPFDGFDAILEGVASSSDVLARYIAKYFHDATAHAESLYGVIEPDGMLHYIVGNSKFFDVVVPTEQLYASIFEGVGFVDVEIETLRKRTSKKELYEYRVSARRP